MTADADSDRTGRRDAQAPPDGEFLTVGDVAQRLSVHPQTVRSWVARGELRAIRIGRIIRVRRADLADMLEDARLAPPTHTRAAKAEASRSGAGRAIGDRGGRLGP